MSTHATSKLDRILALVCLNCPVCRHARKRQQGLAFALVQRVEQPLCPFCRAYERVYGRKAHERQARRGPRQWYRITGLPGWKRAQLGMPAYGDPHCVPHLRPSFLQRFIGTMRRLLGGRKVLPASPRSTSIQPKAKS
jgi:hypothetical protein